MRERTAEVLKLPTHERRLESRENLRLIRGHVTALTLPTA